MIADNAEQTHLIQGRFPKITKAHNRFVRWLKGGGYRNDKFREVFMGCWAGISTAEVLIYMLLNQSSRAGELPPRIGDIVLIALAVLEVITAPFLSWFGYWKRRNTILICTTICGIFILCILTPIPGSYNTNTARQELCNGGGTPDAPIAITPKGITRLVLLTFLGLICSLTRQTIFPHAVAYLDEHNNAKTSRQFGILILARFMALWQFPQIASSFIENKMMYELNLVGLVVPLSLNLLLMWIKFPVNSPRSANLESISAEDRSLWFSVGRVISNKVAMSQIVSMSLLLASVWGFGLYEKDYIKAKYLIELQPGFVNTFPSFYMSAFLVTIVIFYGITHSRPYTRYYRRLSSASFPIITSLAIGVVFIVLTVMSCRHGNIAGISDHDYLAPQCSSQCHCVTPEHMIPVCVVDEMTTYLSPCHAGCSSLDTIQGIEIYSNCTCGTGEFRLAVPGACSFMSCLPTYSVHHGLFVLVLLLAMITVQNQGVQVLRAVDLRDKSVAMGVAMSVVALVVFLGGTSIYLIIAIHTCSWKQGGACQLQAPQFVNWVGYTCAGIAFCAVLANSLSYYIIKKYEPIKDFRLEEYRPDESEA